MRWWRVTFVMRGPDGLSSDRIQGDAELETEKKTRNLVRRDR